MVVAALGGGVVDLAEEVVEVVVVVVALALVVVGAAVVKPVAGDILEKWGSCGRATSNARNGAARVETLNRSAMGSMGSKRSHE